MSNMIQDGTGTGNMARVSDNELHTRAVIETEEHDANEDGRAYNINTGIVNLTSGDASSVLYVKNNNDSQDLVIAAIAVGIDHSTGGSSTEMCRVTIIRNPTSGTIVDDATDVAIKSNRNYGSSNTLTVDAYKGAEGKTGISILNSSLGSLALSIPLLYKKDEADTKEKSKNIPGTH